LRRIGEQRHRFASHGVTQSRRPEPPASVNESVKSIGRLKTDVKRFAWIYWNQVLLFASPVQLGRR
jgi:hypothetical protein